MYCTPSRFTIRPLSSLVQVPLLLLSSLLLSLSPLFLNRYRLNLQSRSRPELYVSSSFPDNRASSISTEASLLEICSV
ncbi:hypothetical protein B0H65DRAFT_448660 [Neurospora tetraspora]|uniref:Uncharacterized protein n=1 Tax=Neurospora tetraspora TaxID=94610 RepID=A0AAE0MW13_9PEZI|nr:hypothetical protein B0H65DRAFT_448660 [Neurospora tetraspora]